MMKYRAPLDPECPAVAEFIKALMDDPLTTVVGAPIDDILEGFERFHRPLCERCRAYGVANIEVVDF